MNLQDKKVERMNFINDVHIQALQEDRRGQLWITTLKDATCYQPSTGAVLMNSLVSSSQNEWNRQYFDNSICLSPDGNIILSDIIMSKMSGYDFCKTLICAVFITTFMLWGYFTQQAASKPFA